jgi:LPS-assembly lipoprotein
MSSSSLRSLVVMLACSAITACGFHLRGADSFPADMAETYILTDDRFSPFYRQLSRGLDDRGIRLLSSPIDAGAVIRIQEDTSGQRISAVSARNIPQEYDVYYAVQYSVWIAGEEVLPGQRLTRNQVYDFDSTQILGKSLEEQVLVDALAEDLVQQLIVQLVTLKK